MFYRMIRMKIRQIIGALLVAGTALLVSCAQDAVFYTIQYDKLLNKDPVVPGGPTKIVEIGDALYVGSDGIYRYAKPTVAGEESRWRRLPNQPGGKKIMDLAGTGSYLYALVMKDSSLSATELVRLKDPASGSGSWETVDKGGHSRIQSISGAGDTLFAGTSTGGEYVLYIEDTSGSPVLTRVTNASGMLKAAAKHQDGTYYVSLIGRGILKAASPQDLSNNNILQYNGESPDNFFGFIEIEGELIAVSGDGWIWRIGDSGNVNGKKYDARLNGALAKWKNPVDSGKAVDLLLLGRAVGGGSSMTVYYYGYSELSTGADGKISGDLSLQTPGQPQSGVPTSVSKYDTYYNTLGTHAVTSLYQAPWDTVLFASTQQSGLWSCRGDPKEWDIE
jgi:hypothetical protein